jgi:transposase InsO family protein
MNGHKGARTTAWSRAEIVRRVEDEGQPIPVVAAAFGLSGTTVRKWLRRFRAEGTAGLIDRTSRPATLRAKTSKEVVAVVVARRRERQSGRQIAQTLGLSTTTVSRILRRAKLSRWKELEPVIPVMRDEKAAPGELLHFDTKKLGRFSRIGHRVTGDWTKRSGGRGVGWEALHVAIDDHARVAHVQLLTDERTDGAVQMLRETVGWYREHGIRVQAILTDNGACYRSGRFRAACAELGVKHKRTRPYTPRTNGKAERLIQTTLREWAYAKPYDTSEERAAALPGWVEPDNTERPHHGIGGVTPMSRLEPFRNNLLQDNT